MMILSNIQEDIKQEKSGNPKKDEAMTQIILLKLILDELRKLNENLWKG